MRAALKALVTSWTTQLEFVASRHCLFMCKFRGITIATALFRTTTTTTTMTITRFDLLLLRLRNTIGTTFENENLQFFINPRSRRRDRIYLKNFRLYSFIHIGEKRKRKVKEIFIRDKRF